MVAEQHLVHDSLGHRGRLRALEIETGQGLGPEQRDLGAVEPGPGHRVAGQVERQCRIFRQHAGRNGQEVAAGSGADRPADPLDRVRHLIGGTGPGAFGQEAGGHRGQALLARRVDDLAGLERQGQRHDREPVVFHHHQPETVRQNRFPKRRERGRLEREGRRSRGRLLGHDRGGLTIRLVFGNLPSSMLHVSRQWPRSIPDSNS